MGEGGAGGWRPEPLDPTVMEGSGPLGALVSGAGALLEGRGGLEVVPSREEHPLTRVPDEPSCGFHETPCGSAPMRGDWRGQGPLVTGQLGLEPGP